MGDPAKAYLFRPGESEVRWMGVTETHFLATGALTGGEFGLVEETSNHGISVPLHRHDEDVESFYVLEGSIAFFLGEQPATIAPAGSFVHIPRGTVHGFRIESKHARYLILTTPRHAEFYRAISGPEKHAEITGEMIGKACREFGITFVGPLPTAG